MHPDDRYRRAAAADGIGIWDWNLATGEIFVDPLLKKMLGYEDHEIRNHLDHWGRLVHPDDAAAFLERARAHIAGDTPLYEIEHRLLHRDGSIRWFLARGAVIRNAQGKPTRLAGTETDITRRKRDEEALRQAQEINRRIAESTGDCVKILSLDGRLVYINAEGLRILEINDAGELLNRPFLGFWDGAVRQAAEEALALALRGGRGRFQAMRRTASGKAKWWDIIVTPITGANDTVVQLLAVSRDVTERRREEAFRDAQHRMLEMIAGGSALPDVLDRLVRLVEQLSDGMLCSVLLLDEGGMHMRHGAAGNLPDGYLRAINGMPIGPRAGSCGTAVFLGTRVIATDILTDPLWADYRDVARRFGLRACWSMPIFSPQRRVLGSFAMYYAEPRTPTPDELRLIDTAAEIASIAIEQQRAHQALRRSEERNQAILRAIPDLMFLTTVDGVFLDYHASDPSSLYMAPPAFLGKSVKEVLPAALADTLVQVYARVNASDKPEKLEYPLEMEGSERFYEACIVRCDGDKILSIVRDITDRKLAETQADAQRRQLAHLSRVAMLGDLSGAMAHELSQPLAAMLINAHVALHLLDRHPVDHEQLRAVLDDIIRSDRRAGAVIDRMRALLRKADTALQPVDMNEVVREVLDLSRNEISSRRITASSALAPAIAPVLGDRVQLEQVVLNLVLNACEAMNETQEAQRRLLLSTKMDNGFVQLAVSDRGPGIPAGERERVFEAFVTSRDQGLGLGLAISRSIVTAHGGSIRAENNADGGATFRCLLPIAGGQAIKPPV
jgi:PAS domain S-box-containing protein